MAAQRALRAVSDGEKAAKRLTVAQAAESGDRRALLVAMRERIAKTVSAADCPPRDLASLSRRLQEIAKDLEALDAAAEQEATADGGPVPDEAFDTASL